MKKAIVYFTDSRLEQRLDKAVRNQILKAGIPVISVSQKPLDFGKNICVGIKPRCYLSLYEQLLEGIEAVENGTVIYTCEHDVFYHPSHFEFVPPNTDKIFFNLNRYYCAIDNDFFVKSIGKRALSQAVAFKNAIHEHVLEQVELRKKNKPSPCVGRFDNFASAYPNIDIRHGGNFSSSWAFKNLEGKKKRIATSVDHWGTPLRFQDRVGYYRQNTDTEKILHELLSEGQENPVEVKFVRNDLPKVFQAHFFTRGAEVGVKKGLFSKVLCEGVPNLKLKCIDPYLPTPELDWDTAESYFAEAKDNLKGFNVEHIKKTSKHAAAEDVPKWSLDFVYIDADHRFDSVMQDIIIWTQRVRPGGIVSGHDYDNPDVKAAVDVFTDTHKYELFITQKGKAYPDSSPSWFFAKGV